MMQNGLLANIVFLKMYTESYAVNIGKYSGSIMPINIKDYIK